MDYPFPNYQHWIAMPPQPGYMPLWYGYIDESGDPAPFSIQPLVIVALLTQSPRDLELLIKRVFKKTGKRLRGGELKASNMEDHIIFRVLKGISRLQVSIFAVEVDKSTILKPPKDIETLYAWAMAQLIQLCMVHHPRMEFFLDKRYNNNDRKIWLERIIRDELVDMQAISLLIVQEDSIACKPLQAVDFLAWAAGKNSQGNPDFWNVVEEKVECYEVISRDSIKNTRRAHPGGR